MSLNRLFYCYKRLNSDTSTFNDLRNYYIGVASVNQNDTAFYNAAIDNSRKCLVARHQYIAAINEYEGAVQNSRNHADSVSAEINIIEIYLLMSQHGGDSPGFTGRLSYLKPSSLKDALRKIREKMNHANGFSQINSVPVNFSLSQNYPNPFNPVTKIKYSIPNTVNVTIRVYDILGRLVKTLINNELRETGYYEVLFDGSGFASGVYFYRIEAGKFVQSKKMVLIK